MQKQDYILLIKKIAVGIFIFLIPFLIFFFGLLTISKI